MFCPACGRTLPQEAAFCMACGKKVPLEEGAVPEPIPAPPGIPGRFKAIAAPPLSARSQMQPSPLDPVAPPAPDGSVCENHTTTWATVACGQCGRTFCDACRPELNGEHLCLPCAEMNRHRGAGRAAERAQLALLLSICGLFTCGLLDIFAYRMAGRALAELRHAPWATKERAQARAARIIAIAIMTLAVMSAFLKVLSETVLRRV